MASPTIVRELQRDLENKANDLSKLQKDISKNHQIRKKYTIQLGESGLVLKELDLLNEDTNVYKLIGPMLVKQDMAEAKANVKKRIEYISTELYVFYFYLRLFQLFELSSISFLCLRNRSCLIISLKQHYSKDTCILNV
ncbi:prefoldin subunit 6 [Capsicum annuum]|uniref:prefoldin subunit 6 n=1 Tax=Capsicum annuum TaxID=4072 RepID=UPI001FB18816|nr:prefoldin subunit 6 [Capsicum annuum]